MSSFLNSSRPVLFQVNCRLLLRHLHDKRGGQTPSLTLDDVPDHLLDLWKGYGVNILYLLGVWTTGKQGLAKAKDVMRPLHLPDDQICSSPFAVTAYQVHPDFGGDEALARFRARLRTAGMHLLLDFVPNHVAIDHPWVTQQTNLLMPGNDMQLNREPQNYQRANGGAIIAHGRDPHFDGWTDTAQLNYFSDQLREEQKKNLLKICEQCDGLRCDMAMLVCSDVLLTTWGDRYREVTGKALEKPREFWTDAIQTVKSAHPGFIFMAEVYWNMEGNLMAQGFDYCYDKDLYDKLVHEDYIGVKHDILESSLGYQEGLARFLENHDEDRAAVAIPDLAKHRCAAALCYLSPGLKFFHQGQVEGVKEKMQMQRQMLPLQEPKAVVKDMYLRLFAVLQSETLRSGSYYPLEILPSSHDSTAHNSLVAFLYLGSSSPPYLIVANFRGDTSANGFVRAPRSVTGGKSGRTPGRGPPAPRTACAEALADWIRKRRAGVVEGVDMVLLRDVFGGIEAYGRSLKEFSDKGIWFSINAWHVHVFEIQKL